MQHTPTDVYLLCLGSGSGGRLRSWCVWHLTGFLHHPPNLVPVRTKSQHCLLPVPWRMERIVFKAGRESLLTRWYPDACAAERRVCMVQCCQKRNKWYTLGTCASWLSATRQSTLARLRRHLPPDETPSSSSRPPLAVRLWVCMVQCCQKRNKRPLSLAHVHLQPCHL